MVRRSTVSIFTATAIVLFLSQSLAALADQEIKSDKEMLAELKAVFGQGPQEEDLFRIEKLLITATGSQMPVRLAPSVATVITKEEIEEIGATTLNEVLETVAGLHVTPSGINNLDSIYSIRGIHTQVNPQVLFLLNGVALSMNYGGGKPYQYRMPVAMISRVEVVRGPGSAVHGADAFSGVINVITKDNFEINGTEIGARYGSFKTYDTWVQHGGQYMGWDIFGGIEMQKSDGDHGRVVEEDYIHALGAASLSNAPGYLDTEHSFSESHLGLRKGNFTMRLYGAYHEDGTGPGALQVITYNSNVDGREFVVDLEYRDREFNSNWDLGGRFNYVFLRSDTFYQILPEDYLNLIGEPITIENNSQLEATAFYNGFNRHKIRFSTGIKLFDTDTEYLKNYGPAVSIQYGEPENIEDTPDVFMANQNRRLYFASFQDEWNLARYWNFTGGIRLDEYSDFGDTVNPRFALVWETTPSLSSKILYGRAFRAPSFGEQYLKNNVMVEGNPDLNPETIDSFEMAFDYQPTYRYHLSLNIFTYNADNLIEYIGTMPAPAENYGEQKGYGFELETEFIFSDTFKLRVNFAYQCSRDVNTDAEVDDAPEVQLYINPHWQFLPDWSVDGQVFFIADEAANK